LAAEKQQQAEQALVERIGDTQLQFKPLIAKIYTENNFAPLWTDTQAKQQFLHDYALMIAAGISKRSSRALNAVSESTGKGELIEDVILTDAFLDYLYYANNVKRSAQKWLYSENSYKAGKFDENQLSAWLSAVKNNDNLAFIKNLSSDNPLFKQTLDKVKALIVKGVDKNKTTELHRLAINAQRLRILPTFQNGIFVNIPSYQLTYYRDGEAVLNSRVIVGKNEELYASSLFASDVNWLMEEPTQEISVHAKIRYGSREVQANVLPLEDRAVKVSFLEPQRAVTPGQSVVFYSGERLVGGATIESRT